jgi:hypothetical protein
MSRGPSAPAARCPQLAPLALLLAGCGDTLKPTTALTPPQVADLQLFASFRPATPTAAAQLLAYCYSDKDAGRYPLLLPADFQFAFEATDTFGDPFVGRSFARDQELTCVRHMFVQGSPVEPPAQHITVVLGTPTVSDDPRPGRNPGWHQVVRAPVTMSMDTGDMQFYVTGGVRLFMVRGDSARIPADLAQRGMTPDPGRWWIERWEDTTGQSYPAPGTRPLPAHNVTWGSIKALYYSPPPP